MCMLLYVYVIRVNSQLTSPKSLHVDKFFPNIDMYNVQAENMNADAPKKRRRESSEHRQHCALARSASAPDAAPAANCTMLITM